MSCYMNDCYQLTAQNREIRSARQLQTKGNSQAKPAKSPENVESLSVLLWGNAYHGWIRCSPRRRLGSDGNDNAMPLFRFIRFPNFFSFFSH